MVSTLEMSARIDRGESLSRAELEFFMQGSLNIALKQFAEVRHVLFFDGASLLAGDIDRYLLDPVHPGEEGARRLADVLSVYFRELFRSHAATP